MRILLVDLGVEVAQGTFAASDTPPAQSMKSLVFFFAQMLEFEAPVILDIGAGVGLFSLLAKFHPGATVHAFEPAPRAMSVLQKNIKLNNLESRVTIYPFALFNKTGTGKLRFALPHETGLATLGRPLRGQTKGFAWVETRCLDDLPFPDGVDLIKMDVEGAELMVLQGGKETIRKHKPGIMMEYLDFNTRQFDYEPSEIDEFLKGCGYSEFRLAGERDMWATPYRTRA